MSAYNVSLDWLVSGKIKSENENLTADKQFAPLDGINWVDGLCAKKSDSAFPEHEKTADTSAVLVDKNVQHIDFFDSKNKKTADTSAVSGEGLTVRCLRLSDENADLLRQNGDLRVEVERQRMDIERRDARIAELERQLAEPQKLVAELKADVAQLNVENRELHEKVRQLERMGLHLRAGVDRLQHGLPESDD